MPGSLESPGARLAAWCPHSCQHQSGIASADWWMGGTGRRGTAGRNTWTTFDSRASRNSRPRGRLRPSNQQEQAQCLSSTKLSQRSDHREDHRQMFRYWREMECSRRPSRRLKVVRSPGCRHPASVRSGHCPLSNRLPPREEARNGARIWRQVAWRIASSWVLDASRFALVTKKCGLARGDPEKGGNLQY